MVYQPDIIVNAAAYTSVDKAETQQQEALVLNRDVPKTLAQFCRRSGARLIHYSTDYVFSGRGKRPWVETDPTDPVNFYGFSKREGEDQIKRNCEKYFVFRTSWVFSESGQNFVNTILQLLQKKSKIDIVSDQIGNPTSARYLARVTECAVQLDAFGSYHTACSGFVSWYDFAKEIVRIKSEIDPPDESNAADCIISAIPSEYYPTPAKRPLNSRLDCSKWAQVSSMTAPNWETELLRVLDKYSSKKLM
jgi:dTDP-4-dehydrorhamnose reductase